jgi:hypothetical protein
MRTSFLETKQDFTVTQQVGQNLGSVCRNPAQIRINTVISIVSLNGRKKGSDDAYLVIDSADVGGAGDVTLGVRLVPCR